MNFPIDPELHRRAVREASGVYLNHDELTAAEQAYLKGSQDDQIGSKHDPFGHTILIGDVVLWYRDHGDELSGIRYPSTGAAKEVFDTIVADRHTRTGK